MLDLTNITLAGLFCIGVVNVLTFWKPEIDSKIKFGISLVVALGATFIPLEFGNTLLDHLKTAITIAFASSGVYKIAQKTGGIN